MKHKKILAVIAAIAAFASFRAYADVIWVDAANYGKAGLTGETKALAYGTIQDAVDAASAGDTIRVLPGVYDQFGAAGAKKPTADSTPDRVYVGKDNLTLIAEDKKPGATVIKGAYANGATEASRAACGEGAVACVGVSIASTFRMEGFTLEEGATLYDGTDNRQSYGGAFHGYNARAAGKICLVDCTIRNCAAGWGIVFGATCIRCSTTGCFSNNGANTSGLFRQTWLYNCVVAHNYAYDIIGVSTYAVNTTFCDNKVGRRFCRGNGYIYNSIVVSSGSITADLNVNDCGVTTGYPVMATAADDWRVRKDGGAEAVGTAANLMQFDVPSDCRYVDFYGKPIPSEGAIAAGASQEVVTPAGGGIVWGTTEWQIDGKTRYANAYAFPAIYPTQYLAKVQLVSGRFLMRYKFGSTYIPAEMDDSCWMMPSPSSSQVDTVAYESTTTLLWVDKTIGDDSTATGTEALPYRTIQAAVAASSSGTRIHVKKGVYDEGGDYFQGCSNRVQFTYKTLRIVGVDGAAETIIKGEKDSSTLSAASMPGCGAAAMRCVLAGDSAGQMQGFTLSGGRTDGSSGTAEGQRGGAVWFAGSGSFFITDCVISDCRGGPWGVVRIAPVLRCRFENCHGTTSMFHSNGFLTCCVFASDNGCETASYGIIPCNSYHCSIVGTAAMWPYPSDDNKRHVSDAIEKGGTVAASSTLVGCVLGDISSNNATSGFTSADPRFVDSASTDLRVLSNSPVFEAGEIPTEENYGVDYYLSAMTSDIDGNRLVFNNGKPVAGAHHIGVTGQWIGAAKGGLAVSGAQVGANVIDDPTATVTIEPSWSAAKPCVGFTVNGVTNLFDNMVGAYTMTGADIVGKNIDIEAIYTKDWYVDAVNGVDDAAHVGFTPKTAKHSLSNVLALAASGDTVHALPGVYRDKKMLDPLSGDTYSRAVVPNGVSLVADGGPDVTAIEGEAPMEANSNGLGGGATRCVALNMKSTIKGFTLRGGRTKSENDSGGNGGGVFGIYNGTDNYKHMIVEDCVISNCAAYAGGGVYKVTAVRCRLLGNKAAQNGAATYNTAQYGCRINGNFGSSAIYAAYEINGCTVGPDRNLADTGAAAYEISTPNKADIVKNSLIYGTVLEHNRLNLYRCYVVGAAADAKLLDGSRKVSSDDLSIDETSGEPVIGQNVGIDMADLEYFNADIAGDVDLLGGQRVYNGAMDIGAIEADWRPRYGNALGRHLDVTRADPDVVESAGGVLVTNGALCATWANPSGESRRYDFSATVTGNGMLTVLLDGEAFATLTATDGAQTLTFESASPSKSLSFSYAPGEGDTGGALLASFRRIGGFQIIFR